MTTISPVDVAIAISNKKYVKRESTKTKSNIHLVPRSKQALPVL